MGGIFIPGRGGRGGGGGGVVSTTAGDFSVVDGDTLPAASTADLDIKYWLDEPNTFHEVYDTVTSPAVAEVPPSATADAFTSADTIYGNYLGESPNDPNSSPAGLSGSLLYYNTLVKRWREAAYGSNWTDTNSNNINAVLRGNWLTTPLNQNLQTLSDEGDGHFANADEAALVMESNGVTNARGIFYNDTDDEVQVIQTSYYIARVVAIAEVTLRQWRQIMLGGVMTFVDLTDTPDSIYSGVAKGNASAGVVYFGKETQFDIIAKKVASIPAVEDVFLLLLEHDHHTPGSRQDITITPGFITSFGDGIAGFDDGTEIYDAFGSASGSVRALQSIEGEGAAGNYGLRYITSFNEGWIKSLTHVRIVGTNYALNSSTTLVAGVFRREITNAPTGLTGTTFALNFRVNNDYWYYNNGTVVLYQAGFYQWDETDSEYAKLVNENEVTRAAAGIAAFDNTVDYSTGDRIYVELGGVNRFFVAPGAISAGSGAPSLTNFGSWQLVSFPSVPGGAEPVSRARRFHIPDASISVLSGIWRLTTGESLAAVRDGDQFIFNVPALPTGNLSALVDLDLTTIPIFERATGVVATSTLSRVTANTGLVLGDWVTLTYRVVTGANYLALEYNLKGDAERYNTSLNAVGHTIPRLNASGDLDVATIPSAIARVNSPSFSRAGATDPFPQTITPTNAANDASLVPALWVRGRITESDHVKGAWANGTAYVIGDIVTLSTVSDFVYVALQNHNGNNFNAPNSTSLAVGDLVWGFLRTGDNIPESNSGLIKFIPSMVISGSGGSAFICRRFTTQLPAQTSPDWFYMPRGGYLVTAPDAATGYLSPQLVQVDQDLYLCYRSTFNPPNGGNKTKLQIPTDSDHFTLLSSHHLDSDDLSDPMGQMFGLVNGELLNEAVQTFSPGINTGGADIRDTYILRRQTFSKTYFGGRKEIVDVVERGGNVYMVSADGYVNGELIRETAGTVLAGDVKAAAKSDLFWFFVVGDNLERWQVVGGSWSRIANHVITDPLLDVEVDEASGTYDQVHTLIDDTVNNNIRIRAYELFDTAGNVSLTVDSTIQITLVDLNALLSTAGYEALTALKDANGRRNVAFATDIANGKLYVTVTGIERTSDGTMVTIVAPFDIATDSSSLTAPAAADIVELPLLEIHSTTKSTNGLWFGSKYVAAEYVTPKPIVLDDIDEIPDIDATDDGSVLVVNSMGELEKRYLRPQVAIYYGIGQTERFSTTLTDLGLASATDVARLTWAGTTPNETLFNGDALGDLVKASADVTGADMVSGDLLMDNQAFELPSGVYNIYFDVQLNAQNENAGFAELRQVVNGTPDDQLIEGHITRSQAVAAQAPSYHSNLQLDWRYLSIVSTQFFYFNAGGINPLTEEDQITYYMTIEKLS